MKKLVLCIDFDGTIVEHQYPKIGPLRKDAYKVIRQLKRDGHIIIIWTCRSDTYDLPPMKKFLEENRIPYDYINENSHTIAFKPHPKVYADVYIDDHNLLGLPGWDDIYRIINQIATGNPS